MANPCSLDADFVRARLAELGLSQRALADELGFELRTLQRWMAGTRIDTRDAERIAHRLSRGMRAVCRELPAEYDASPLRRVESVMRFLETRDATFAEPMRVFRSHWKHWVSLLELHAEPVERYVARLVTGPLDRHRFVPVRIRVEGERCALRFHAQVLPRVRYAFGRVDVDGDAVRLEEFAFTRAMNGRARDGELRVDVWISDEVAEIVVTSDDPFELTRLPVPPTLEFQRSDPELTDAVCFRPSTMDLRLAGLPTWDDRLR